MADGVAIRLDATDVRALSAALERAAGMDVGPLMEGVAAAGESATRERIEDGGPAPDGTDWAPRSSIDKSEGPLLNRDGHLLDSIASEADDGQAIWGSPIIYARIHQMGGDIVPDEAPALWLPFPYFRHVSRVRIPARPYLGVGEPEERLIGDVVESWLGAAFGESPG